MSAPMWPFGAVFAMAMSSAEKMRGHRERKKRQRCVVKFEIDMVDVGEALVAAGYLDAMADSDSLKLAAALQQAIARQTDPENGPGFAPVTGNAAPAGDVANVDDADLQNLRSKARGHADRP